ncbi:MAG: SH3 domain-containing protein [Paracoccaceae bacterium]
MIRFIAISFVFLAFAFFQMSGGLEFDPVATRMSRIEAPENVQTAALEPQEDVVVAELPEVVTRVSLDLIKLKDVVRPSSTLQTVPARVVAQKPEPIQDAVIEPPVEPTFVLPSLIEGASAATVTPVDFSADPAPKENYVSNDDIRSVTGNRVNLRGGPGKNFGVVNSMVRGDQVVILEDPGNGWVRLRSVQGSAQGWMADFLLSDG